MHCARLMTLVTSVVLLLLLLVAAAAAATTSSSCSASANALWLAKCDARTATNKPLLAINGLTHADMNQRNQTRLSAQYSSAKTNALQLSKAAGNKAMSGLRKKTDDWYAMTFRKFLTYLCVETSSDDELARCTNASSPFAAHDIHQQCLVLSDKDNCYDHGQCERTTSCKWDDPVAGANGRREFFTTSNVSSAQKWVEREYPASLLPFVTPGIVMAVFTGLGALGFLVLRCLFNQCGGKSPREKGYSRCDVLVPSIVFLCAGFAVFVCAIFAIAANGNISDDVDTMFQSANTTLLNVQLFADNLLQPLGTANASIGSAVVSIQQQMHDLDWIERDGTTLLQMINDFKLTYAGMGPFPFPNCDPITDVACIACPENICGGALLSFTSTATSMASGNRDAASQVVTAITTSFAANQAIVSNAVRKAYLMIATIRQLVLESHEQVFVAKQTFEDYSFSRTALVICVFVFSFVALFMGVFAILKGVCNKSTTWVQFLHVVWLLSSLVCVLGFVLSASLLAVSAVWYDACNYLNLVHTNMTPFFPTTASNIFASCFNDTSLLPALQLEEPLAFSCAIDDNYAVLSQTNFQSPLKDMTQYGKQVSEFSIKDFHYDVALLRDLFAKANSAMTSVLTSPPPNAPLSADNVLTPWELFGQSATTYDCASKNVNSTSNIPLCYMTSKCNDATAMAASTSASSAMKSKCATTFAAAYKYKAAFVQITDKLQQMQQDLLGDTVESFSPTWKYDVSIHEFAQVYYTRLSNLKPTVLDKVLQNSDLTTLLASIDQLRCSQSCGWLNLPYNSIHDSLCNDILGTTLAISLDVFFLCIFLIPMIVTAIVLQKRLRGVKKGTYEQLEKRLQALETKSRQEKSHGGSKPIELFKFHRGGEGNLV